MELLPGNIPVYIPTIRIWSCLVLLTTSRISEEVKYVSVVQTEIGVFLFKITFILKVICIYWTTFRGNIKKEMKIFVIKLLEENQLHFRSFFPFSLLSFACLWLLVRCMYLFIDLLNWVYMTRLIRDFGSFPFSPSDSNLLYPSNLCLVTTSPWKKDFN